MTSSSSLPLRALLALAMSVSLLVGSQDASASGRLGRVRQILRRGDHHGAPAPGTRAQTVRSLLGRNSARTKPRITTRIRERIKRLPRKTKIIVTATAIAVVASSVLGGFYVHGQNKNKEWSRSPSHAVVLEIEDAVGDRDAAALDRIGDQARVKLGELERQLAAARATGAEKLANGMTIGEAERELDFAGFAIARADLEEALLSGDAGERIGGHTVGTWSSQIPEAEAMATSSGFEGALALRLKAMHGELQAQEATVEQLDDAIDEFAGRVPRLWGDQMRTDLNEARGAMTRFRDSEVSPERKLYQRANAAMRGRVSDRLASESTEFAGHRARWTRLASVQDELVRPAAQLAQQIDADLASVISHRRQEQSYLAIAATKTSVPVQKTKRVCCRTELSADGKSTKQVEYDQPYTDYEDQSGTWKALAATEASLAQSAADDAQAGLKRLRPLIVRLHNNPTLQGEELIALLPEGANADVDTGHGPLQDWFLPPLFNLFSGALGNAQDARQEFKPVMGSLGRVDSVVGERRGKERSWVESSITRDLDAQITRAEAGETPATSGTSPGTSPQTTEPQLAPTPGG